jgi:hypothetical protein
MQAFLARLFVALSLSFLGASYSFYSLAASASGAPRGLTPPQAEDDKSGVSPVPAEPPVQARDVENVLPDQPGQPRGPKVTVSSLDAIDPAGVGLIDESGGGLPRDIHEGSTRAAIVMRIARLPGTSVSPVLQSLQRRILLSSTQPPAGETPEGEPSMLAQRLFKLVDGGRIGEAAMLGAQSPRDDRFARQAWVEALLLQGRDADACGDAASLRQSLNDPFWMGLRAYCHLVAGDMDAASLTLDVMRERPGADEIFVAVASALVNGSKAKIDDLPDPAALQVALLRRAALPAPSGLSQWLPGRQLILSGADPVARLAVLERSARAGLVSVEDLVAAYRAAAFSPDQLDDPEAGAAKLDVASGNALFFQGMLARSLPAARAAAFAAALDRADAQNNFPLFARATRQVARQMPVLPETAWLAPHIFRVLLYNGDAKAALQWQAQLTSPTDTATLNALRIHAAIVYPSAENTAALPEALTWLGINADAGSKAWLRARALREVPLLAALGYTIPPEAQWALSAVPGQSVLKGVSGEAVRSMAHSAQQQRKGEAILDVLIALGDDGPSRAPVAVVARAVDALSTIGMRDPARALAGEAILATPVRNTK